MRVRLAFSILATCIAVVIATSCAQKSEIAPETVSGPSPPLAAPDKALLPTVKISPVVGWKAGEAPTPASGVQVNAFATGLVHPRWLYVLPNGDVLVAETNRPPTPDEPANPIRAAFMNKAFAKAGADVPSPNRISLLRDNDGDGVAETKTVLVANLFSPFGMALVGDRLYIANADALVWVPYKTAIRRSRRRRSGSPTCPARRATITGPRAWSRRRTDRSSTSASVPTATSPRTAWTSRTTARRSWRSMRRRAHRACSPAACAIPSASPGNRGSGVLYAVVNERDELGNDLVPDYLTSVNDGAFYGWPYSYYGAHVDTRVTAAAPGAGGEGDRAGLRARPACRVAGPGVLRPASSCRPRMRNGAFIGLHGSWNRDPHSGYKVVFVPFADGKPAGEPSGSAHRFPRCAGQCARTPGGRGHGEAWRVAGRRRCRQRGVARGAVAPRAVCNQATCLGSASNLRA